jgi:hypothetical protein
MYFVAQYKNISFTDVSTKFPLVILELDYVKRLLK